VDHIGGLAECVGRTGAEVAVHPLDSRAVAAFDEHAISSARATQVFFRRAGMGPEVAQQANEFFGHVRGRSQSVPVAFQLHDGRDLDGLRIIHTPGHSPGQVCIAVGDVLLSADHVLPVTVTQQWPESVGAYYGLGHYLDSLDKIQACGTFRVAIGGHEAAFENVDRRIENVRETQHRRLSRVLDILRGATEPLTLWQIAVRMYGRAQGIHAVIAAMDAGSRVEYLYERGYLSLANLDETERDEVAPPRYRG
jgi:glyoxylase-like metal-dependent hydrolase (beta-lactamase superfamily II)